jgi:sulfite reductase alpha subunit-like flavoprotein
VTSTLIRTLIDIEFSSYDPGDVAVIHPMASFTDVETFLGLMGWEDIADVPFAVEQRMFGAFPS